jgi:hypothetical protein
MIKIHEWAATRNDDKHVDSGRDNDHVDWMLHPSEVD